MKKFLILIIVSVFQLGFGQKTEEVEEVADVPFVVIENVPIYPGCEDQPTNSAKKKCMSNKLAKLVMRKFNTSISDGLGLPDGLVSIYVTFKIDKEGKVADVKVRAPHKKLKEEAIRIVSQIPIMKPATHRGKPVVVNYTLPIKYKIENEIEEIFPTYKGCEKELTDLGIKECSIKRIKDLIKLSFDYDIADRALPQEKSTQFQVDFVVDKNGEIKDVNAKANHKAIAIEAIRATKELTKFKVSGMRNGEPIDFPISLTMTIYF